MKGIEVEQQRSTRINREHKVGTERQQAIFERSKVEHFEHRIDKVNDALGRVAEKLRINERIIDTVQKRN